MKTTVRPIIMALVLVIAGTAAASGQRGMGRMANDTARIGRPGAPMMRMQHMNLPQDSIREFRNQMHSRMMGQRQFAPGCPWCGPAQRPGFRHGMPGRGFNYGPLPGAGFRPGAVPRQFDRPGFGQRPGPGGLAAIPNLTDKQKKDIEDLRTKQFEETKKIREEHLAKMKTLRETHRKNFLNLLTEEQKKFVDGNTGASAPETAKKSK